ncbi:YmL15 [Clonorchis sinensis]|uniref:Large ribosomal subunit protein uL15m n=1 Tax=Clonorchis sinensis TaxID=79923 RepID=A0A8T1MRV9_CLOSI|nr:YmL15 [Clonorchis sinensis]
MSSVDRALRLLRNYPRVCLFNVTDLPRSRPPLYRGLNRKKKGLSHRGMSQFQAWPPLGQVGQKMPFYLSVPKEPYNTDVASRRSLARISLLELQRMIDLDRIDPREPIDLTTICNTNLYKLDVEHERHYGFQLTDEGCDIFVTPVNIEVQYASEPVIAAVERAGGVITTRFYDLFSVWAKCDPASFFRRGIPIPRAKLPPPDAVPYYANAENRGYLADPEELAAARLWLAQKYGYSLTDCASQSEDMRTLMSLRKDPRQIFLGLNPGDLVSLANEVVLKPRLETEQEQNR